jgi:hypothetical protein
MKRRIGTILKSEEFLAQEIITKCYTVSILYRTWYSQFSAPFNLTATLEGLTLKIHQPFVEHWLSDCEKNLIKTKGVSSAHVWDSQISQKRE